MARHTRVNLSALCLTPVSLSDSVRETRVLHLMHRGTSDLTMLQARLRRQAYESAFSRRIAVAMGLHVRLGSDPKCLLHLLDADSINMIVLNYY